MSWEDRAEKEGDQFAAHPIRTVIKWGLAIFVIVIVFAIVGGVTGFIGSWFGTAAEVAGPTNVKAQYHAVIEDWQSMERQAENVCEIRESKGGRSGPTFLEDPAQANAAIYRRIQIDYNRRQANIFEAKEVGPSFDEYPEVAPTLAGMQEKVCGG